MWDPSKAHWALCWILNYSFTLEELVWKHDLPGRWEALDWVELEFRKIGYAGAGRICHYPFSHPWPCTKWVLSRRIPDHLF